MDEQNDIARLEAKIDMILEFIDALRGFGRDAVNAGGMTGMMARSMIPPSMIG